MPMSSNDSSSRQHRSQVLDVPAIARPLIITDAAINIVPTLDDKADIILNAIDLANALGLQEPRVAILSAMETLNLKVPSTLEAAALCKMADRGQIVGGVLDGPLALDSAINPEAARIKRISSPVAGHADILVAPDLEAGNMRAKSLTFMANADAAGIVLGARARPECARKRCRQHGLYGLGGLPMGTRSGDLVPVAAISSAGVVDGRARHRIAAL